MYDSNPWLYVGGYHGTDISSAERIAAEGFRERSTDICFATLDNLSFAQSHGLRRAMEKGDTSYGVIQAMFPGKRLEFGLDGDQIQIPVSEIGRITIVGLMIFSNENQLISSKTQNELLTNQ